MPAADEADGPRDVIRPENSPRRVSTTENHPHSRANSIPLHPLRRVTEPRPPTRPPPENEAIEPRNEPPNGPLENSPHNSPQREAQLDSFDIACLDINKMIGTGIFITPATVVQLVGSFSGSVGNAIAIARYIGFVATADQPLGEWLQKFIACWVTVGICLIHYRFFDFGVKVNNSLAGVKVLALILLILGGLFGGLPKAASSPGGIQGDEDFGTTTHTSLYDSSDKIKDTDVSGSRPVNVALAILLVLYSYQGWENANYVTADIRGSDETKRRVLKKGALSAVTIVSLLYIMLNVVMFFVLELDNIIKEKKLTIAYQLAAASFDDRNPAGAQRGISALVALSALGNLIGVIFTNGRVKREIARSRLIPFWSFFGRSSNYGIVFESGLGTPTGGLILHGLFTCATITATPFFESTLEGWNFVVNLYTYGHSIISLALVVGICNLGHRMERNQTSVIDPERYDTGPEWDWRILSWKPLRFSCLTLLVLGNLFIIVLPFVPSPYTDGSPRRIPTWRLPATIMTVFAGAALIGVVAVTVSSRMEFQNTTANKWNELGRPFDLYVKPGSRLWKLEYPKLTDLRNSLRERRAGGKGILEETKARLLRDGEGDTARDVRARFDDQPQPQSRV
ncbi:MAG: hypothetical protein M1833_003234 [Piccolia ochrophora]|nr:MAG: hypothetical protein M1833_003234 [Piccolia ochrophora]